MRGNLHYLRFLDLKLNKHNLGAVNSMKLPINKAFKNSKKSYSNLSISMLVMAISACGGGGGGSDGNQTPTGSPPTISVEPRVLVSIGDAVTLSASATDPDGDNISFSWQQLNGEPVANTQGFSTSSASFNASNAVETITFRVTATSGGQSATDTISVIVLEDTDTAVFIDADFTGVSMGTIDAPYPDFLTALEQSPNDSDFYFQTPADNRPYAIWGNLNVSDRPRLVGGNSIYGGFDDEWLYDPQVNITSIEAEHVGIIYDDIDIPTKVAGISLAVSELSSSDSSQLGIIVLNGSSEFTLENTAINVAGFAPQSGTKTQGRVFGAYLSNVATTRLIDNHITVGNGATAPNTSSRPETTGVPGNDGDDGRVGLNIVGGDGGSGREGLNGGKGGNAGNNSFETGKDGKAGKGRTIFPFVSGGKGGTRGFSSTNDGNASSGENGGNGSRGNPGRGATGFGSLSSITGVYLNSIGKVGGIGYLGGGGGGGGGGAGGSFGQNGGAGGGGGEGGEGGRGGFGARSGGASIAVHIAGGSFNEIENNTLVAGDGGKGGRGGLGSDGGDGGEGGKGDPGNLSGGKGGNGGNGGKGGEGGIGGSGAGGPSFGIFLGVNTPANISKNSITSGQGGEGSAARFTSANGVAAGEGGWSYGIFDGLLSDNFAVILSENTFTIGNAGQNGGSREGSGKSGESNID